MMATFTDTTIPRKRITTYGKSSARKRISNHGLSSAKSEELAPSVSQFVQSRSPSIAPLESEKPESTSSRHASIIPSSASPVNANMFDVPSCDDETAPTPRPISKKSVKRTMITNTKKVLPVSVERERSKKVKLFAARRPSQEPPKARPAKRPDYNVVNQASMQLDKSLETGRSNTIVARPKLSTSQRKVERPSTPDKNRPSFSNMMTPATPSKTPSDTDAMDVDYIRPHISPRGVQIWKDILEPLDNSAVDSSLLELETRRDGNNRSPTGKLLQGKTLSRPAGIAKQVRKGSEKVPRQRLIDSLADQGIKRDGASEDTLSSDESEPEIILSVPVLSMPPNTTNSSPEQVLVSETPGLAAPTSSQGSQSIGPKFTYSRQRSMLSEKDIMQELALDIPTQPLQTPTRGKVRRGVPSALTHFNSFPEDEDDIEGTTGIRSVHELRQAGANNRFLDEIEDILDQVGKPSTPPSPMRRAGLLSLAIKMKDKEFQRKFRANGMEQRLFLHLDEEEDFIAGFAMVSILNILLVDKNMPHVVIQLRRQGITKLLIRLIANRTGIVPLSKDRQANMSKVARSSISQLQDLLLKLPVWEDLKPQTMTPRTTALKCLELMIRQTREAGDSGNIISKELTSALFSILKSAEEDSSWELPNGQQAIDFCLALSALESHSITARSTYDGSIWISEYLPIIANTLEIALSRPVQEFGLLQVLILRLTLNVTNNNHKASEVFARESLMAALGQAIVTKFNMISRLLTEEELSVTMDHLILELGVMINFAEWSSLSRKSLQSLEGMSNDPLAGMVQLFLDNRARTSEAESVEETQKNVAFGYLSVLLGYLSLLPDIAERIRVRQPQGNIRPLLASIEEFIVHHKTVDGLIEADGDGHSAHNVLTEKLEDLVTKLGDPKLEGE